MGKTFSTGLLTNGLWQDASNNIGIGGSPSGSYKLEVTGTGRFSGALTGTTTFTLDGTKKVYLRSAQPAASGLLSGSALAAEGNFSIYSDSGVAAEILGMYYWNGSTYRSALQFANVSSGSSNLILMKDGGNVGIGTSSPSGLLQVGVANSGIYIDTTTQYTPKIIAAGTISDIQIQSVGNGGNVYLNAPGTTSLITMSTNGAERMRITSVGEVLMNTTSALTSGWLCISVSSNNYNAIVCRDTGTSYSSTNYYQLFTNSSNGIAGGITHPTASTVGFYTGPSDQRLKSNIKDVEELVLPLFNNAKLKTYNHIADEDESVVYKGFLAQDMVDNFPEAYGKDKEGYYMYNPIGYIPYLVKAIQELSAQNQDLKSRLDKAGL